jgi:hypothetical protein
VDAVVAVSVDDRENPKFALVHMLDAGDMRARFDRAYAARRKAGYVIPLGRGLWLPLYIPETSGQASHVGGGAGLVNPPIARVPLTADESRAAVAEATEAASEGETEAEAPDEAPLTIAQAKPRLARTYGVPAGNIRIIIEG